MVLPALLISPTGSVSKELLPGRDRLVNVRTLVGGSVNGANYRRGTRMWTLGDAGAHGPNILATALASVWRGRDLAAAYWLRGPVLLTGADAEDLPVALQQQVYDDVHTLQVVLDQVLRPRVGSGPRSDWEAWQQILVGAFAAVPAAAARPERAPSSNGRPRSKDARPGRAEAAT
ncbi:hypothetical protein ACIQF6_28800 [Kitasatospora sp. NPDC092948]|uniref:hypothetical protein n=1 Tax=Kitasatospora sp. NPDC092948 TaxID=3364088 RepID=UPI0038105B8E